MKLQGQHVIAVTEGLVATAFAFQQMHGAIGNGKAVAMPVQHGGSVGKQLADAVVLAGGRGVHREPADFLFRVGGNRGAQHPGDQLCAQADAEHLLSRRDALADQYLFRAHPGKAVVVIGAHGAAHDHQHIKICRGGQRVTGEQQRVADADVPFLKPAFHGAQLFEGNMGQVMNTHGDFPFLRFVQPVSRYR